MTVGLKITLSAFGAGAIYILSMLWFTAHRDAMLDDHDRRIAKLESVTTEQGKATSDVKELLGRIDERIRFLIDQVGKGQHK